MKLQPFLLDHWLDRFKNAGIRHDLAASTGPSWTLQGLLALTSEEERREVFESPLVYGVAEGREALRVGIAAMHGVAPEDVLVTTGASEALHILFFHAAEPGANVVVSAPGFPPTWTIPQGLGLKVRSYRLRHENAFRLDLDEVKRLVDDRTKLILVTSPHNPTGAVLDEGELQALGEIAAARGALLVADEVYHPIYLGTPLRTAAVRPDALIVGDFSKALCLSGLRLGYIIDRDPARRERWLNTRMHFTITSPTLSEALGVIALRHRETILARAGERVAKNAAALGRWAERLGGLVGLVPPRGGTTSFPWIEFADDSRPFAEALAQEGVLVAPGDCFGVPRHFRVGLGVAEDFETALAAMERAARRVAESRPVAART
jgi:aspartate/methionine/tyrosine aminotransferase